MTEPFDTETMAELHARQGRRHEAVAIYRRLVADSPDEAARARRSARLAALVADGPAPGPTAGPPAPLEGGAPTLALSRHDRAIEAAWDGAPEDAEIEIVLVLHGAGGVETRRERRAAGRRGRARFPGAAAAVAALGRHDGAAWVPLRTARL